MLILPVQIETVATRADRTLKVILGTQEATPYAADLVLMNQKIVYVAIKEAKFTAQEEDELNGLQSEFVDNPKKRPSRRLRDVLYRLWEQDKKGFEDANLHYLHMMERIIEHYKAKLP